jgi:hypothetical protein
MHVSLPVLMGQSFDLVMLDPAGKECGLFPAEKVLIGATLTMSCYQNLANYFSNFDWKLAFIKFRPAAMQQSTLDELERFSKEYPLVGVYHNNVVNSSEFFLLYAREKTAPSLCFCCTVHESLREWINYSGIQCAATRHHVTTFFAIHFGKCKVAKGLINVKLDDKKINMLKGSEHRMLALDD